MANSSLTRSHLAPNAAPPTAAVRRATPDTRHSATSLIDESIHRLRVAPPGTLTVYYVGTLPFILALLYFWADQGHNPDAEAHGSGAALGLALLFLWMKICQAVFAARLSASIRRQVSAPWTWTRLARLAVAQTALQPSGLFALPIAAVLTVPFGWVYAFYQNVTVLGDGATPSIRAVFSRAGRHALREPRQNHVGLGVLSILALFVWLNLIALAYFLPQLARMFTGEENLFTRSGVHLFNTTFFAVTGALVYLTLDPLAKTFYALRCFHADSRRTGEDLKSELAALPPPAAGAALAMLGALCLLFLAGPTARAAVAASPAPVSAAAPSAEAPAAPGAVSPPELGRSISDVLRRREFAWRAPRQAAPGENAGPLDSFFDDLTRWWKGRQTALGRWFNAIAKKLDAYWHPRDKSDPDDSGASGAGFFDTLTILMISVMVILVAALGWLLWQNRRGSRRGAAEGRAAPAAGPAPDLTDDSVLATQLFEDEWLQLARGLVASGNRRLALRAFYLSILAGLGERGLLAIARHKSNRDYVLELRRRARDQAEAQGAFARNVSRFERVWYGQHDADDLLLADFQADRQIVLG